VNHDAPALQDGRIRIKMWDEATSVVLYDNQGGTDDNADLGESCPALDWRRLDWSAK